MSTSSTFYQRIKQTVAIPVRKAAALNVVLTGSWIQSELAHSMAPFDITPAQYNVMRILRGSHPESLHVLEIKDRMLDESPDITRLLDRLNKKGVISRRRSRSDRRVVEVFISENGLELLSEMTPAVEDVFVQFGQLMTQEELQDLSDKLDALRSALPIVATVELNESD